MKFVIKDPVFFSKVTFFIGDEKGFYNFVPVDISVSEVDGCHMRVSKNGMYESIIYVRDDIGWIKTASTLAHELLHFVFEQAETLGITHSDSSEEFYTYLQGYYLSKALKKIYATNTRPTT